ncbi:MAG TPA: SDR family oxidoreductase [Friedmanniella sp.]
MSAARVAVVTGAGSGIGAAVAVALAGDGWRVVLAGRRQGPLDEVATTPVEGGGGFDVVPTDVTDEDAVRRLFDGAVERHGRVDLLVNNAGRGLAGTDIDAVSLADWQAVVDVNLTGMFLCLREAFRVMRHQDPQGGRIINNGSISAHAPRPRSIAYTATKHAVSGLTKQVQLDGRPYRISCGQIDIGNAASSMGNGVAEGALQADGSVRQEPTMPLDDVAKAVLLMADLPPGSNVATLTVLATDMPYVGRG